MPKVEKDEVPDEAQCSEAGGWEVLLPRLLRLSTEKDL